LGAKNGSKKAEAAAIGTIWGIFFLEISGFTTSLVGVTTIPAKAKTLSRWIICYNRNGLLRFISMVFHHKHYFPAMNSTGLVDLIGSIYQSVFAGYPHGSGKSILHISIIDRSIITVLGTAISKPDKRGANWHNSKTEGSVIHFYALITIGFMINHLIFNKFSYLYRIGIGSML
jgi:hypothetical protein